MPVPDLHEDGRTIHRRETRRQIWLPAGAALLLVLLLGTVPALLSDPLARLRVAVIADVLFTVMILCPAVLCLFLLYVLVVAAIYGMWLLQRLAGTPLQRLEKATATLAQRVAGWTGRINQQVIGLNERFAALTWLFNLFDAREAAHHAKTGTARPDDAPGD
ncbi:MAG: hypothetical protein MUE40_04265 [Anaerolineae bacterium]|jgi:hypothetical protein|nr:hypothetical protein [Anaerolineae bacterium]